MLLFATAPENWFFWKAAGTVLISGLWLYIAWRVSPKNKAQAAASGGFFKYDTTRLSFWAAIVCVLASLGTVSMVFITIDTARPAYNVPDKNPPTGMQALNKGLEDPVIAMSKAKETLNLLRLENQKAQRKDDILRADQVTALYRVHVLPGLGVFHILPQLLKKYIRSTSQPTSQPVPVR